MKNTLKAWLRDNPLTSDPSDFVGVPASVGSVSIAEIVAELKKEGMEIKEETVIDIVSRFNRKSTELVLQGYVVNTGLVIMRPAIKGAFRDRTWDKDKHSVYVNVNQGAELRKAISQTKVEFLGEQSSPMAIFGITDLSTGKTDGTLTKGKNAEIKGTYLKVAGTHADNGVYLTNIDTKAKTKLEDIVINEPSRLLVLIPASLPAGNYELSITTQFSNTSKVFLKTPRTEVLNTPVVIA